MWTYHRTGYEYHPREFPFSPLDDRLAMILIRKHLEQDRWVDRSPSARSVATGSAAHEHSLEAAVEQTAHRQAEQFVGVAEHVALVAAPAAAAEVEEGLFVVAIDQ